MTEKTTKPIHRIDLALPVAETESLNVFCTIPSNQRPPFVRTKTQTEVKNKPMTRIRSPGRLKHLMGPSQVNLFLDVPASSTTFQSSRKSRIPSTKAQRRALQVNMSKDETIERLSQSSSIDRLLFESVGSFEDQHSLKMKPPAWRMVHRSQMSSSKVLHVRRAPMDLNGKISDYLSYDNRSQESISSTHERLCEQIEHLTQTYFPSIRQLRHQRAMPELPALHRMYLHREETNRFMPNLSRSRVVK